MATPPKPSYDDALRGPVIAGRAVTWIARRNWGLRMMQRLTMRPLLGNEIDGLVNEEIFIPSTTTPGHKIRTRVYKPVNTTDPLPGLLYAHGGGYQIGCLLYTSPSPRDS